MPPLMTGGPPAPSFDLLPPRAAAALNTRPQTAPRIAHPAEAALRLSPSAADEPLSKLKEKIQSLQRPVNAIISIRSDMERGRGDHFRLQARLSDQERALMRSLEDVKCAADRVDPPTRQPPRQKMRCATPSCRYLVHPREAMGGFCCASCHENGSHGPRCQHIKAPPDAEIADKSNEPLPVEQIAQVELDEAVRLIRARGRPIKPATAQDNTWLATDPKWSRSGQSAIGTWVSSIIDDEFGSPDNAGPKQLLEGGIWTSRKGCRSNQWIVLDLRREAEVLEIRTRGHYVNTMFNPKRMELQAGGTRSGPWRTVKAFSGMQDGEWAIAPLVPSTVSRWWRLYIISNWGAYDYVWLHGLALRVSQDAHRDGWPEDWDAFKKWTQEDLRKNDADWDQLRGYQKLLFHALFRDRVLFLEDKPYIDYKLDSVEEYANNFLCQTSEMGWSLDFDPNFFCELAYEGFNPTSIEIPADHDLKVLTPCFELERDVLTCLSTHISKKTRKRARHYTLTMDVAYEDVMLECIHLHGEGWLYRGERSVLRRLRKHGYTGSKDIKFATRSFELWNKKGELVAGDLGYTLGGVYVSQTGFHKEGTAGAGELQLVLMSAFFHRLGHKWLDLGQAKAYKSSLGAETLGRKAWLERFRPMRDQPCSIGHGRIDGEELLQELSEAIAASKVIQEHVAKKAPDKSATSS